jgi:hypothetical protein
MEWCWWCVVALLLLLLIWLAWYFLLRKPSGKRGAGDSGVCGVWDRWQELEQPVEVPSDRTLHGTAWVGNQCPSGALLQHLNRKEVACVSPADRADAKDLICSRHISNETLAKAVPPVTDGKGCCDHWIRLTKDIEFEAGTKKGTGWMNGSLCPAGAMFQLLDGNEEWCVLPQDLASTTARLQAE